MRIFPFALLIYFSQFPASFCQSISSLEHSDVLITDTIPEIDIPEISIIASKGRIMKDLPGSASYLSSKDLKRISPISGNEVLRKISGVHVVDEEGLGLRANIGIRGLDPDRSSRVLVLEDGIPVALNPFGEPQMYYTPKIDRMEGVEVLKGSGQILFGPQTVGGVINYLTADPPKQEMGSLQLTGGQGGFFSGLIGYGNTQGNVGYQVNYLRKQADQIGPTWLKLNDLSGKIRIQLNGNSKLRLKLGYYDELSNSTYVGLTQALFNSGDYDNKTIAENDQLSVSRISASATHERHWNYKLKLTTTAFAYRTTRNWQRQDFSYSEPSSYDYSVGEPLHGLIFFEDSNGHRNRQFEVAGIEPRLHWRLGPKMEHSIQTGARFLTERAFEQRVNGTKGVAESGLLKNDENRSGQALSAFIQGQATLGKIIFTGGLRAESYHFKRDIHRLGYVDTNIIAKQSVNQLIPGIGLNYNINSGVSIFAGLHRGFAPPRVKDAIANSGEVYQLEPELSWNLEAGIRSSLGKFLNSELTIFRMDFSNQIIPISESSGGSGSGLINGGSSLHQGIEIDIDVDLQKVVDGLRLSGQVTLIDASY
ncbi:MAG: TonB-dependent receptor, partial [Saprospiraceae bacterium]|nr:TonB-dependent receptor [Saprospiraceae bacterium]